MEALMFMLDCMVIVAMVYMGLRDDRRSPSAPATSLFRTRDRAGEPPAAEAGRSPRPTRPTFQPLS